MKYVSGVIGCCLGMVVGLYLIIQTSSQMSSSYQPPEGYLVVFFGSLLGVLLSGLIIHYSAKKGFAFLRSIAIGNLTMVGCLGGMISVLFVVELIGNYREDPSWAALISSYIVGAILGTLSGVGFHLGFRLFNDEKSKSS